MVEDMTTSSQRGTTKIGRNQPPPFSRQGCSHHGRNHPDVAGVPATTHFPSTSPHYAPTLATRFDVELHLEGTEFQRQRQFLPTLAVGLDDPGVIRG